MASWSRSLVFGVFACLAACATTEDPAADGASAVSLDTSTEAARRQHAANVTFARDYVPRCSPGPSARKRALVTGFVWNVTGAMMGEVAGARVGGGSTGRGVVPPDRLTAVGTRTVRVPVLDEDVDVCAVVLPVFWDVAAAVTAREIEAFRPDVVVMSGIGGPRQKVWLELGSANLAALTADETQVLAPPGVQQQGGYVPVIASAPPEDYVRPNLLSWDAVLSASAVAVRDLARSGPRAAAFGDVAPGVTLAASPRAGNTFVCNNLTYVVGTLMDHPGETVRLLEATTPAAGTPAAVEVRIAPDLRHVPRVFVHWPGELADHPREATRVLTTIVGAQLAASARGDAPTRGDPARGDPNLVGGASY